MIFKKNIFFIGCFVLLVFSSCVKTPITNKTTPNTFSDVFEQYWNMMNINYVYWDIDPTDWDYVYTKYKPLFAKLDLNNTNDIKQSVAYFQQMSSTLIDHHYNISFLPNSIADSSFLTNSQTAKYRVHYPISWYTQLHALYPQNFPPVSYTSFWDLDTTTYFKNKYFLGQDISNPDINNRFKVLLSVINNIAYFSFNQFSLSTIYYSNNFRNPAWQVIDSFLTILNNIPKNGIKGIIIDVRENGGGDVSDLNFLVGRFIDKPLQVGYTKYKSNNGRLQFTPWVPSYINPLPVSQQSAKVPITLPIVALVDVFSASASELTTMGIKALPNGNGRVVGDTTFGATGPYTGDSSIWNDGPFVISNFMEITTSSGQFKYIDGKSYEGKGFPPDKKVSFNFNSFFIQGKDLQLEAAFKEIDNTIIF